MSKRLIMGITLSVIAVLAIVGLASAQTNVLDPVFMFPGDTVDISCIDGRFRPSFSRGVITLVCEGIAPPPTPEPTETPPPTPEPTVVPPTPTPTEPPVGEVPFCDHDHRAFHTLVERDASGAIICHYDHEHGDDPHEVDDVFGTDVYALFGGEISYPWETPDENLYKHGGYAWYVRSDMDVSGPSAEGCTPYSPGCFRNIRALVHGVGEVRGNMAAFHSFYMEAEVCHNGECGIVRVGGWQGPSTLNIDGINVLPRENDNQRNFLAYFNTGNRCCTTWYTGLDSQIAGVVIEFGDQWNTSPIPPDLAAPEADKMAWMVENSEWRCPIFPDGSPDYENCRNNSSYRQLHIATFGIPPRLYSQFPPEDGFFNLTGYLSRDGEVNPACTEIGLDCVPFSFENVPVTTYQVRSGYREYDIPRNGNNFSGWIAPQIQLP